MHYMYVHITLLVVVGTPKGRFTTNPREINVVLYDHNIANFKVLVDPSSSVGDNLINAKHKQVPLEGIHICVNYVDIIHLGRTHPIPTVPPIQANPHR